MRGDLPLKKDAYEDLIAELSKQFGMGLWFSVAVLLALVSVAQASTITAASCGASAVQAALTQASAGDTVFIPAGTCSWTTGVSWTAPANVTLQGAGSQSTLGGGDKTVIIDNYTANIPLLNLTVSANGTFRMTGITVQGGSGVLKDGGLIHLDGPGTVRLDHLHLNTQSYSPSNNLKVLWVGNGVYGVLDHSILDLYSTSAIYIYNGGGSDGEGNATWTADTYFGGSNFFFIEDNQINGTPATHDTRVVDCFTAGRVVIRFNNLAASCAAETHATGHAFDDRGCRAQEIYGNLSVSPQMTEPNYVLDDIGNGTALVWGNQANSVYKNIMHLNVTRKDNATYSQSPTPTGWGYCGTQFNGTGSNWDQNSDTATGYACIDQPGRGKGDLLTGSFPNKVNSTTGTIHWPNQALEPIYFWGNVASIVAGWGGSWYSNETGGRAASDRDYYAQASGIQTSATSPFNGTTGTGWGTLANRPTTCTAGVGYFATDQGSWNTSISNPYGVQQNGADGMLYKCTATNTWALYYTPYTYPHPLTRTQTAPAAPTNLQVK